MRMSWRPELIAMALRQRQTAQGAAPRTATGVAIDAAVKQWDRKKDTVAMAEARARRRARQMLAR